MSCLLVFAAPVAGEDLVLELNIRSTNHLCGRQSVGVTITAAELSAARAIDNISVKPAARLPLLHLSWPR